MVLRNNMTRQYGAFSLVEMMVVLIMVSIITSALAPMITKKLKSKSITISKQGGQTAELSQECSRFTKDCLLCTETLCALCEKDCQAGEYKDSANCTCETCLSKFDNCLKCRFSECTSCNVGYKVKDGLCEICPDGYYQDEVGQTTCKICEEDYYCQNGIRMQCAKEKGSAEGSSTCSDCPSNCIDCKNPSICLACTEGYYLKDKQCAPCPIGCATCDSDTNCLTCKSEHSLISTNSDNRCVQTSNYQECYTSRCATCTKPEAGYCTSTWYSSDTTTYPEKKGCCGYYRQSSTTPCGNLCSNGTLPTEYCSGSRYEVAGCEAVETPLPTVGCLQDGSCSGQIARSTTGTITCQRIVNGTLVNSGGRCTTRSTTYFARNYICDNL